VPLLELGAWRCRFWSLEFGVDVVQFWELELSLMIYNTFGAWSLVICTTLKELGAWSLDVSTIGGLSLGCPICRTWVVRFELGDLYHFERALSLGCRCFGV